MLLYFFLHYFVDILMLLRYNIIVNEVLINVNNNFKKGGKNVKNTDVREAAKKAGVKLWQIADAIGITDGNFSRKLRKELPEDEKQKIFAIIDDLSKGAA